MHRIFFYGTVKRGGRNAKLLESSKAVFIGEDRTTDSDFLMAEFPSRSSPGMSSPGVYLSLTGQTGFIYGDVYDIDDAMLEKLDVFEKVGIGHKRISVPLQKFGNAFIYLRIDPPDHALSTPKNITYEDGGYAWLV